MNSLARKLSALAPILTTAASCDIFATRGSSSSYANTRIHCCGSSRQNSKAACLISLYCPRRS